MSDEKEYADRLNSYIDNAPEAYQELDEQTKHVIDTLRQSARYVEPTAAFVHDLSARLQEKARTSPQRLSIFERLTFNLFPRLLWGGVAVAALVLLLIWLPAILPATEDSVEPAISESEPVATGLPAAWTEAPATLPLYQATAVSMPATVDEVWEWAASFGLPDPEVFFDPRDLETIHVRGSNGYRLTFGPPHPNRVYYDTEMYDPQEWSGMAALPFAAAADIAVDFLEEHDLLPAAYLLYEDPLDDNAPLRIIYISPDLDDYRLQEPSYAALTIAPDGTVLQGAFTLLDFTAAESVAIKPAQQVYEAFLSERVLPFSMKTQAIYSDTAIYAPPAPQHEIGETVTVTGQPMFLVSADNQETHVTLKGTGGSKYDLSGADLARMPDVVGFNQMRVEGRIVAAKAPNYWLLEVNAWEIATQTAETTFPMEVVDAAEATRIVAEALAGGADPYPAPEAAAQSSTAGAAYPAPAAAYPGTAAGAYPSFTQPASPLSPAPPDTDAQPQAGSAEESLSLVIDRMELVYYLASSPGASGSEAGQQIVKPVWMIVGRDTADAMRFVAYIDALEDD